jgi:NAD-dependent dihydropyrimidine dehydrogenase PreA subunit
MVMKVNQELCTGCGVCAEACSAGAIQLIAHQAVIDEMLCTGCEACIEACPNGAITAIPKPVPEMAMMTLPTVESRPVLARFQTRLQEIAAAARGLAPLAGTALAYLGREIAPRMVDVCIGALESRLAQPAENAILPTSIPIKSLKAQRRGKRRQACYRGGQVGIRNRKGRR